MYTRMGLRSQVLETNAIRTTGFISVRKIKAWYRKELPNKENKVIGRDMARNVRLRERPVIMLVRYYGKAKLF
jgi:hypothetical protein